MAGRNGFTPTQQRIVEVLADGKPHKREEVLACLLDEFAEYNTVNVHMYDIRQKLRPKGMDVICELRGRSIYYRQVRLLASAIDGRR